MFLNQWLRNLRRGFIQASPRRRRNQTMMVGPAEVLELRTMLSAAAVADTLSPVTYVANTPPVLIAPTAQLTDSNNAFAGSTLDVKFATTQSASSGNTLSLLPGNGVSIDKTEVLVDGAAIGSMKGDTPGTPLVVMFNATATQTDVQDVLHQVAFSNSHSAPTLGVRTVDIDFVDGHGDPSPSITQTVDVVTPAAISGLGPAVTYVADNSPVLIAMGAQVSDSNNAFSGSKLDVQYSTTQSAQSGNTLSLVQGNGVTVNAGEVLFDGSQIGSMTGGATGVPLLVKFNSSATQASVQAVLEQVAYSDSHAVPTFSERTVVFEFTDGNGNSAAKATQTVHVVSPASIADLGPAVTYVANTAPVLIASGAQLNDLNNAIAGSKLDVQFSPTQSSTTGDKLSVMSGNGVTVNAGKVLFNAVQIGTVAGGTDGARLLVSFNSAATQAGVQAVLDQVAFSNSHLVPGFGDRTVVLQFTDGNADPSPALDQTVHLVTPASIAIPASAVTYVADTAPVLIATGAQLSDVDNAYSGSKLDVRFSTTQSASTGNTLTLVPGNGVTAHSKEVFDDNIVIGKYTGGTAGAPLIFTFNSSATQDGIQAVLDQAAFTNSHAAPTIGNRTIVFQFINGNGDPSASVDQTVHVVTPAAITGLGPAVTYVADSSPVLVAAGAKLSDSNNAFDKSQLDVQFSPTQSAATGNLLSLVAGNGVTGNAGAVLVDGVTIGSMTGGTAGAPLIVKFNSSATQAGIQAVLNQVAYSDTLTVPKFGAREVVVQFVDGDGNSTGSIKQVVQVVTPAAITGLESPVTYTADAAPVLIASAAQLTDANNSFDHSVLDVQFSTIQSVSTGNTLTLASGNGVTVNAGQVIVNNTVIGSITGETAGAELSIVFDSNATQASIQAVLDQVAFSNSNLAPSFGDRTVVYQFTDGNGDASASVSQKVDVVTPAAITGLGPAVTYVANTPAVLIAPNAQLTDANNAFNGSKLDLRFSTTQSATSGNELTILPGNGVTVSAGQVLVANTAIGSITGGTPGVPLVITFNSSATQANVQSVLEQIAFVEVHSVPTTGNRGVLFQLIDGNGDASKSVTQTVDVVSPAAIAGLGSVVTYVADTAPVLIASGAKVTDSNNAFAGSKLDVQFNPTQSATTGDVLSVVAGNGVTVNAGKVLFNGVQIGTVAGGTDGTRLLFKFNSLATQASVQAVLDQIAFSNSDAVPAFGSRKVTFQFTDGTGNASPIEDQKVDVVSPAGIN